MIILIYTILGAVHNALRGGQYKKYISDKYLSTRNQATLLMVPLIYFLSYDMYLAIAMAIGYNLVWRSGVRDYIATLMGIPIDELRDGRRNHLGFIEKPFEPLTETFPRLWGFLLLTVRGAMVGLLSGIMMLFGHNGLGIMLVGLSMGAICFYSYHFVKMFSLGDRDTAWRILEYIFGGLFLAVIAYSF